MKALIVVPFAERRGGAETMLLHLLRANAAASQVAYSVAFLADGPMVAQVQALGYQTHCIPSGRLRELPAYASTIRRLRALLVKERADVAMAWMAKAQLYLGPAAATAAIPAVWWQHGIPEGGWLDRLATAAPARLVLCCSSAAAAGQRRLRPHRRIAVVYPAVDTALLDSPPMDASAARAQLGLPPDDPLVGIAARLQAWKGVEVFIAAAALMARQRPEVRFAVVGGSHFSEPDYPRQLQEQAARLGLADRVTFAGHRDDADMWLRAMDVVVHASTGVEPFGMVIIEAMALGRPVVASARGGPLEIVADGANGALVTPGDPAALAARVAALLDDAPLRGRLAAAGKATARRFSDARLASEVAGHLSAVISPAHRRG